MDWSGSMRRLCAAIAMIAGGAVLAPGGAAAAGRPAPFGHVCTAQNGVRYCPTSTLAQRVPSFDGVPLDVDVTLPPTGNGPFPTIVMLHGWGGDKTSFESNSPSGDGNETYHYNNVYYAQQGYAVLNYTARGFGNSCGSPSSRTADCAKGWIHLADQRYEARDTQYLLGLLVDEKVTNRNAIGVTGISYGGGQSIELAYLKNRVRLPDGRKLHRVAEPERPAAPDQGGVSPVAVVRPRRRAPAERTVPRHAGRSGRPEPQPDRGGDPELRQRPVWRRPGERLHRARGRRPAGRPDDVVRHRQRG